MNEKDYKKLTKENKKIVDLFKHWLKNQNLSNKTMNSHLFNVDLFINEYLIDYQFVNPVKGIAYINDFMEDFFVRKCMWSNASSMKTTAASLKKFYQCLADHGKISEKDLNFVKTLIKNNIDFWIETVEEYNNFDEDEWF